MLSELGIGLVALTDIIGVVCDDLLVSLWISLDSAPRTPCLGISSFWIGTIALTVLFAEMFRIGWVIRSAPLVVGARLFAQLRVLL